MPRFKNTSVQTQGHSTIVPCAFPDLSERFVGQSFQISWYYQGPKNRAFVCGPQKGPAERGHVKKRQKSSKSVKNIFDTFRHFSRRAKNVKNRQKVSKILCQKSFRNFSTIFARHPFSGPFWEALILSRQKEGGFDEIGENDEFAV